MRRVDAGHAELERILGSPIESMEHAPWGFTNRTDVVTMAGGERLVIQRYVEPLAAANRLQLMAALLEPLHDVGITTARVIHADLDSTPPYAVIEELPGAPGQVAAGPDLSDPVFVDIAAQMGALARQLAAVSVTSLRLKKLWAEPAVLRATALTWLEQLAPLLDDEVRAQVAAYATDVPDLFEKRPVALAHGDLGPSNVLVADGTITGLVDLEFTQLADPLFDVAWFGWLLRFHYPRAPADAWPAFAAEAGVDLGDATTALRIATLQVLRVLEAAVYFGGGRPRVLRGWARRVPQTLAWWSQVN